MGIPIPVTTTAVKLSGTAARPYLLTNDPASSATVYIGQSSGVNSSFNYALTLSPGASITWTDINSDVWAITSSGTALVTVAYEASGTFVPGKTGAAPTLLQTVTVPFTSANNVLTSTIQDINVGAYNSVKVMVSVNITSAPAFTPYLGKSWIYVDGVQYDAAYLGTNTSSFARTNSASWTFGDGYCQTLGLTPSVQTYQFSVQNSLFAFNYGIVKDVTLAAASGAGTVTIRVYGSQQIISSDVYTNWTTGNAMKDLSFNGVTFAKTTAEVVNSNPAALIPYQTSTAAVWTTSGSVGGNNTGFALYWHVPTVLGSFTASGSVLGAGQSLQSPLSFFVYQYSLAGKTTAQTPIQLATSTPALANPVVIANTAVTISKNLPTVAVLNGALNMNLTGITQTTTFNLQ
jgi:hypothetical protein